MTKGQAYVRGARKPAPPLDFKLYVCPALAKHLNTLADRDGHSRPKLTITDYAALNPCCLPPARTALSTPNTKKGNS